VPGTGVPWWHGVVHVALAAGDRVKRRRQLERMLAFDTLFSCQGARIARARARKRASHCSTGARPRSKAPRFRASSTACSQVPAIEASHRVEVDSGLQAFPIARRATFW